LLKSAPKNADGRNEIQNNFVIIYGIIERCNMIDGIEPFFQEIADSIQGAIQEPWSSASMEAIFYSDHIFYLGEYQPGVGGATKTFATERLGENAFVEIRERFRAAGQRLWGRARLVIHADGTFEVKWGYDDCDENGFARFEEQAEMERIRKLMNRR
jgi:hypothetical protein